jgi:2,3-bisphosphoglycerate-independent phosphoglycerate mutase
MGNSEVGHLSIGAGRVYYKTFPRINRSISSGEFFENESFLRAIEHVKKNKSKLHILGLISSGGVHGVDAHAFALLELAKKHKLKKVFIHAILDGRDTVYNSAPDFIGGLQEKIEELKLGSIATLVGRYFTMDRDNRWDRVKKAYDAMVSGVGKEATDSMEALKESYTNEVYDEGFLPTVLKKGSKPVATIDDNDAVIFFNFRPDRARQITSAFVSDDFDGFERVKKENLFFVTMSEYEKDLPVEVAFGPVVINNCLAEVISKNGLSQLHIAETEKYAHVTFFLNGTHEDPFEGEDRVLVPSPKVATYDLKPEMSARVLAEKTIKELQENKYDFIVLNFANPDMVGHTGNFDAAKDGIEVVDECIGKIVTEVLGRDGSVLITSDHGNSEELKNLRTGESLKEHATNPVPLIIISNKYEGQPSIAGEVPDGDLSLMPTIGMLADVAPTILVIMGIEQPEDMTGQPLL